MALYLVQHGKSLAKELDPERGLSPVGISETKKIAEFAFQQGLLVNQIFHSGKKRAEQTAQLFAQVIRPTPQIAQLDGLNPMDDVTQFAELLENRQNTLYVGHLPFMEKLVGFLTTRNANNLVLKFQNSGIVCVEQIEDDRRWSIKWSLVPHF